MFGILSSQILNQKVCRCEKRGDSKQRKEYPENIFSQFVDGLES